jgi:hypothetical protein
MIRHLAFALCFVAPAEALTAQTLAARIDAVRDGTVRLTYAARAGVCGNGDEGVYMMSRRRSDADSWGGRVCEPGPVRVSIGRADGQTVSIRKYVGGRWPASSGTGDLGIVDPGEAARYLLSIASGLGNRNANEAISAAAIADVTMLAPELTRLMRNADATIEARKDALFWLGESDVSASDFAHLYGREQPFPLREQWTFVLAQRHDDPAIDKLIEIARTDADTEIRKRAMFWLGQTKDAKAVQFLHDILLR